MPCYIFVYLGFKVKELNSKLFDIKLGRSIMSSGLFYTCFIAENVFMIVMFFTWSKTSDLQWRRWITNIITASVIWLSFIGTLIHLIFTHRFFSKPRRVMPTYAAEKCRGISRRNYPVTIIFNAERPWKRLFTPGINHVGTSQGRMHLPVCKPGD